jgi:hypothetical protein
MAKDPVWGLEVNPVQIGWRDYQWGLNSFPFRPWFCVLHGQVARDLLSNWRSLRRAISLSSFLPRIKYGVNSSRNPGFF